MLKQEIQNSANEALKAGDQFMLGVLRMLLAAVTSKEKEKRYKIAKAKPDLAEQELIKESELADEEVIDVISSEIKKRKDAIILYEKGNRQELADKEKKEIEILKKYLPEQLSESELRKMIQEIIDKIKDPSAEASTELSRMSSGQVMGRVMADLMPKVKGKADNSEISRIIKEILSK